MFFIIAVTTAVVVYYNNTKARLDIPNADTLVEQCKEWRGEQQRSRELLKTIDTVIFSVATVVYLALSFATRAWYITWLIFAIAAVIYLIVKECFKLSDCKKDIVPVPKTAPKYTRKK